MADATTRARRTLGMVTGLGLVLLVIAVVIAAAIL